jgi:hypothetical protein
MTEIQDVAGTAFLRWSVLPPVAAKERADCGIPHHSRRGASQLLKNPPRLTLAGA